MSFRIAPFVLVLFITGCIFNKNKKIVDVSDIQIDLDINRFDREFFGLNVENIAIELKKLRDQDSVFFDFYTQQFMLFGLVDDSISEEEIGMKEFITNVDMNELYDSVQVHFSDIAKIETELANSLKHFKYYFPFKSLPKIKTVISGFGYNAAMLDTSYLLICLDMHLGDDFIYYEGTFPKYKVNRFTKEHLPINCMEVIYNAHFENDPLEDIPPLIHSMIDQGKKLYFLESMMPRKDKHLLINYSLEQLNWCTNYEREIWETYNVQDLFYSTHFTDHKKHIEESPKTQNIHLDAPGKLGVWVGWQIVNSYMENAGDLVSLNQLLNTDPDVILAKSKYKP